jgi:hypothetical protein
MAAVTEYYANHLAPIYLWMVGGIETVVSLGKADLATLIPGSGLAIDLGAGLGMHSIPLAQAGYQVIAIDQSSLLLGVLQEHSLGLPIRIIEANLLEFRTLLPDPSDLIICMGDTLAHLESFEQVQLLMGNAERNWGASCAVNASLEISCLRIGRSWRLTSHGCRTSNTDKPMRLLRSTRDENNPLQVMDL